MTAADDASLPPPDEGAARERPGRHRGPDAVLEVCPYLATVGGQWRSAYATRDHRCGALDPPAALAIAKQRELCLTAAHRACATFQAAEARGSAASEDDAGLWDRTRAMPLVLDPARRIGPIGDSPARSGGQALLVGLMVLAFLVLVIARTTSPSGSTQVPPTPAASLAVAGSPVPSAPSARPVASTSAVPSAVASDPSTSAPASGDLQSPVPSASASPSNSVPSPVPSNAATPRPSATPRPTRMPAATPKTYKVRTADTLSSIAARFGISVRKLARVNDIEDPALIRVGQVLVIP
jgi:LysM repeat protein